MVTWRWLKQRLTFVAKLREKHLETFQDGAKRLVNRGGTTYTQDTTNSATVGRALAPGRTYALENSKALFCIIAERAVMLPGERLGLLLGSGIVRLTEKFLEHPELARQRPARREPIKLVPKLGKLW